MRLIAVALQAQWRLLLQHRQFSRATTIPFLVHSPSARRINLHVHLLAHLPPPLPEARGSGHGTGCMLSEYVHVTGGSSTQNISATCYRWVGNSACMHAVLRGDDYIAGRRGKHALAGEGGEAQRWTFHQNKVTLIDLSLSLFPHASKLFYYTTATSSGAYFRKPFMLREPCPWVAVDAHGGVCLGALFVQAMRDRLLWCLWEICPGASHKMRN